MKTTATSLAAAFFAVAFSVSSAKGETIAPGATYSQNFDSLGNAAAASLPSGWSVTASSSVRSVTVTEWGAAGTATALQGTGTGTGGGIYNWGDAGNTSDRGVGFLATGSVAKTGNLYLSLTATGFIPSFTVSYDMKCYRNNTRQFQFQLYYSTDGGATWTSAGSDFFTSCAVGTGGVCVNPAGVTSVSSKALNVSLSSGETVILCWSYSVSSGGTTTNAQGLGIDNVSIEAEASSDPAPLATPTGLSVVSVTDSDFSLSWTAVADADDYEVEVLAGSVAAGTVSVSGTGATVGNLSADTAYTAKVKALPPDGSTTLLESDWSVPVSVRTKLADGLEFDPLFDEPFSGSANNSSSWAATTSVLSDGYFIANIATNAGWTGTGATRKAPKSILFGTQGSKGTATTPSIHLRAGGPSSATVRILFQGAKKNGTYAASMNVTASSAAGTVSGTVVLPEIDTTSETDMSNVPFSFVDLAVSSPFTVTFEPAQTDSRCYLDNVIVEQIYDPDYAALAAPTGVAASDVGKYGFTVSWTGVANATGYEVWLNGSLAESCASTDSSVALTGLSNGTRYSVQVRALGDNLHYADSSLTTAISVETEADVQSIVFTVTGAPAGDVYAGDPVSFTVAAAVESTGAAAPVNFSGIAGATFANGTFSWTPAEADVGTNVATFASGTYSTNVAVSVVSAWDVRTLFDETFAGCGTAWGNTATMTTDGGSYVDESGWTFTGCYRGMRGGRLGKQNEYGTAVTRAISPLLVGETVSLSFRAAGYTGASSMRVTATGGASFDSTLDLTAITDAGAEIPATEDYVFGPYLLETTGDFVLSFEPVSGDGRMGVDEILVTQTVSAKIRDLAAPTGLALVGEAGENGFTVGWNAVDGATNYAVRVFDASGTAVFSAPFCATTTVAATGFADDEAYTVQVRAAGDTALYFASDWSAPFAVRTARSALHPTLRLGAWSNVAGENHPVATLANTAAATAELGDGSAAILSLTGVSPAPVVAPVLSSGTLSWTPAEADAGKTFTLAFSMRADAENAIDYATNVAVAVTGLPATQSPAVTVESVSWERIVLSWTTQYRATNYAVRAWTGPEDPEADGTRYVENFLGYPAVKPDGWIFDNGDDTYGDWRRVAFKMDGDSLVSPLFDTPPATLTFGLRLWSAGNSVIRLFGSAGGMAQGDWELLATYSGADGTLKTDDAVPVIDLTGRELRRFMWTFERASGGVGIGGIVFTGSGLPTARFLTGWSSRSKLLGNVAGATVDKVRPGDYLGRSRDPGTGEWIERGTTRRNWAEVTVFGTDGLARSTVVPVAVPWTPYAKRATLIVVQ